MFVYHREEGGRRGGIRLLVACRELLCSVWPHIWPPNKYDDDGESK